MGYFEGLTDLNFKTDDKGKTLFFPWGIIGKGYILPDESMRQQIKRFKKIYHMISIPCISIISVVIVGGWTNCFLLFPIFPIWYFLGTARLLKGIPSVPGKRLGIKESYARSCKSHNIKTLGLMLILSVMFGLAGIMVFLFDRTAWMLCLVCVFFFGVSGCAIGYMIRVRKQGD